jgi:hypothetical protein
LPRQKPRAKIPAKTRQSLWIAAGGRCEFRGCNRSVSRDFLTAKVMSVGEMAHIIADSPDGPRGSEDLSSTLAKDEKNLMLTCFECHNRIDLDGKKNVYTVSQLQAMKREHEERIDLIYSANGVKDSLPLLMSFPIAGHLPSVDLRDVQHAILENSNYTRFPLSRSVVIDRSDFDIQDDDPTFWSSAEACLEKIFTQRVRPILTGKDSVSHLTVAAFAPIPLLMKLGALLGDKTQAMVLDLPLERWLWEKVPDVTALSFEFELPANLPNEVYVGISISNLVTPLVADIPTVEFRAVKPNRAIIRNESQLQVFRREFNAFLMSLIRSGVEKVHFFPATPLCASVEIGRMLLPKTFQEVHVWEWRNSKWSKALRLK